jgi:adenine/guanine phosphoribosyltransferase-like PRPP-binding protein
MWRTAHALIVVATVWAGTPAFAQSVAEFYSGKQITLIVGASAGGVAVTAAWHTAPERLGKAIGSEN